MISVVLATHNEAANLNRCLDSVKEFADEIVIIDGESSDNTVEIGRSYGAKIIETTNKSNFHINKQMAMDQARGEVVLQIDADEVVDQELREFIQHIHQEVLAKLPTLASAWSIKRKNYFLGTFLKKGGQYPDAVIRLYQRGKARLPQRDVHEQMIVTGDVAEARGHLLHYGTPTFAEYLRKFNTYTSFKAEQLFEVKLPISVTNSVLYFLVKPISTFFSLFIRHRGYVDGVPGFVFAVWSGLHHAIAYLKLWEKYYHAQRST